MATIVRNLQKASRQVYDLIVIGGGIHGVMIALEASLRRLKTLLVEQRDFGAATSYNSLRILHGGFRYLQHLDLQRLYESANERRFFLEFFPDLVSPLPCLMPLYGQGLRRPEFIWPALKAYDLLTLRRNRELPSRMEIPNGKVLGPSETISVCPFVIKNNLKGGALWYDGFMPDSQRILIGSLRWACEYGLDALNYVRASSLIKENGRVTGIVAYDEETGNELQFRGRLIVNASGPWCRELAQAFHRDEPALFRSMMAWNVLFDHPAISTTAVAVASPSPSTHTYFIVPWKGMMFAGTGHSPWPYSHKDPNPSAKQLDSFCTELKRALPGIDLKTRLILHVFAGLQSAKIEGGTDFSKREVIMDHAVKGGPKGLISVSGVKFTTARKVAEKTMRYILPASGNGRRSLHHACPPPPDATTPMGIYSFDWLPEGSDDEWMNALLKIVRTESVIHLDDLVIRRTSLGDNPRRAMAMAKDLCRLLRWDESRSMTEIERLARHFSMIPDALRLSRYK